MNQIPFPRESLARSLASHPLVRDFEPQMIEFLASCARNVRLRPDEYLFREDERADTLYLLRQGRVSLQSHLPGRGAVTLESLAAPEALGATALLAPYVWHLDARATAPVLAFALDGSCLRKKMAEDGALGCALLSVLLRDVHNRLVRARLGQLDVYRPRDVR